MNDANNPIITTVDGFKAHFADKQDKVSAMVDAKDNMAAVQIAVDNLASRLFDMGGLLKYVRHIRGQE